MRLCRSIAGWLALDDPHDPACDDGRADEHGEGVGAEADHHPGVRAHRDAEDGRDEEGEEEDGVEVGHEAFLPMAIEWASTAEMMLSRPATTRNFVP